MRNTSIRASARIAAAAGDDQLLMQAVPVGTGDHQAGLAGHADVSDLQHLALGGTVRAVTRARFWRAPGAQTSERSRRRDWVTRR